MSRPLLNQFNRSAMKDRSDDPSHLFSHCNLLLSICLSVCLSVCVCVCVCVSLLGVILIVFENQIFHWEKCKIHEICFMIIIQLA